MQRSQQPPSGGRGGREHVLDYALEPGELRTTSRQRRAGRQGPYARKLELITELITSAEPDLVGVQEILADPKNLTPPAFDDLRTALGAEWTGCLSQRPDPRGIRVGWLARGQLSDPTDIAIYPQQVPATTIDDDNQITAISAASPRARQGRRPLPAAGSRPANRNGLFEAGTLGGR